MTPVIEAVYDEGVFRPRNPVDLINGTVVEISIRSQGGIIQSVVSPEEVNRRMDEIAARYNPAGDNGAFSGADHDEILYGMRGAA